MNDNKLGLHIATGDDLEGVVQIVSHLIDATAELKQLTNKQQAEYLHTLKNIQLTPGPQGLQGIKGEPGKTPEKGKDYFDGLDGLNGVDGKDGKVGEKGDAPKHEWKGTELRFQNPDGTWGQWTNLRGLDGMNGVNGFSVFGGGGGPGGLERIKSSGIVIREGASEIDFGNNLTVTRTGNGVRVDAAASGGGTVGPGTINELAYFDTTSTVASLAVATYPSLTELAYVKGVTSAIQTQLNAKQALDAQLTSLAALSFTGNSLKSIRLNASETDFEFYSPAGTGDMVLASAQTNSGIKTFLNTTMKLRNVANTFDGYFVNTNTADRIYTLPDKAGTVAMTSDITGTNSGTNTGDQDLSGYVKTDQTVGQTIGLTGARLTKLWATDITVTNAIAGSVTGSAATLTTARAIYGNNFDGSAALAQIIASTYGGTGNGFTKFTGPTTAEKTFTLPDASATLLYSGGALGTPASGTLTNATGLPLTGLVSDTTTALGIGSINLGHASDTTITRVSAGVIAVEGVNVLLNGGALGTPASGTLTNATGLPIAGLVASTSTALGVGSVELGHATDTTLSRVSAGVIAVEGVTVPTISSTSTLTNKRTNPRLVTAASYTTDTGTSLDVSTCDQFEITAQAGALLFNSPGGTPVGGQKLIIRIKDNGTARALTYNAIFRAMGTALPSTTVLSKTLYLGFIYNATDTKWDLIAAAQEA